MRTHGNVAADDRLGPNYRRFLTSAALSNLGDGIRLGAMPLLALRLTDDPTLIAGVLAVTMLPWVLVGPLGGVLVDRYPRRGLMAWGQAGRGVLVGGFTLLLLVDQASIGVLYAVAFGVGLGEVVVDTAAQAAVPQLAPDGLLDRANARVTTAQLVLDQMVGVALGSVLFTLGAAVPFAVDAVTFLVGGAVVATIRNTLDPQEDGVARDPTTVREEMVEGFRFLWRSRVLRSLAGAVTLTNLGLATGSGVLVILLVEELGTSEAAFGIVLAVASVGGLLGSLVAERIVRLLGRSATLLGAMVVTAVSVLGTALATNVFVVGATAFTAMLAVVVFNIPGRTLRQQVTPKHLLGRVVASSRVIGLFGVPVGAVLGGAVTSVAGVRMAYATGAVLLVGSTIVTGTAVRRIPPSPTTVGVTDV